MRPPVIRLHDEIVVDSFAGGGGASLGIEWALGRSPDVAINHDAEAIAMHARNHPDTRHYIENVWKVDPAEACRGRRVGLAWFSPDCKHHSKAKGKKPVDKKIRALAWIVVRWAKAVQPRVIVLENVEEFEDWGPVGDDDRPIPDKRGVTFRAWWRALEKAGYRIEMRLLRACDFGAPTTRRRLFIIARSDGLPIVWPDATHEPSTYRTAAECIQWEVPTRSIFGRAKPLADNTLARIARGVMRYVVDAPEPFIVPLTHQGDARVHGLGEPMRTVTAAKRGELGLVVPSLVQTGYGERPGQAPRCLDIRKPLGTIIAGGGRCGNGKHALVQAFLAKHYGDPRRRRGGGQVIGQRLSDPIGTVTVRDHHSLVATSLVKLKGTCADGQPVTRPMPTICAEGWHIGEVRAFLVKYYGTGATGQDLRGPMHTVRCRDSFGVVTVAGEKFVIGDIGMRMLEARELFRAQGFPDTYVIEVEHEGKVLSKTAQIRMCGNSVSPNVAAAIVAANVGVGRTVAA